MQTFWPLTLLALFGIGAFGLLATGDARFLVVAAAGGIPFVVWLKSR